VRDFSFALLLFALIGTPILLFISLRSSRQLYRKNLYRFYSEYLNQFEGKNFFCYNNTGNTKEFIENNILPSLPKDIEIIFLNGKTIETNYSTKFISHILYNLKQYHKFPHLIKIRNKKILDHSINNTFYNIFHQNLPLDKFFNEMNIFFDLEGNNS